MRAIWKKVPSMPHYAVSNIGQVKALDIRLRFVDKLGRPQWRNKKEKIISQQKQNGGYCIVHLYKNNIRKAKTVHSLVAEAFIGKRPQGLDVCHKNGKRHDNRLSNLRYATCSENFKDMHRHGTFYSRITNSTLMPKDIYKIRELKGVVCAVVLGDRYGIKRHAINRIWRGATWGHIK